MVTTPGSKARPRLSTNIVVGAVALVIGGMVGGSLGGAAADSTYSPQLKSALANVVAANDATAAAQADAARETAQLHETEGKLDATSANLATASTQLTAATAKSDSWMSLYDEADSLNTGLLAAYNLTYSKYQEVRGQYVAVVNDFNLLVSKTNNVLALANDYIAQQQNAILGLGNDLNGMIAIANMQVATIAACNVQIATLVDAAQNLLISNSAILNADFAAAEASLNAAIADLAGVTGSC